MHPGLENSKGLYDFSLYTRNLTEGNGDENAFSRFFGKSPLAFWELDGTALRKYIKRLKKSGVKNFNDYLQKNPIEVYKCAGLLKITNVNNRALRLFNATSKRNFTANYNVIFGENAFPLFTEVILSFIRSDYQYQTESRLYTLDNTALYSSISFILVKGFRKDWSKIIVSVVDLTDHKNYEPRILERFDYFDKSDLAYRHGNIDQPGDFQEVLPANDLPATGAKTWETLISQDDEIIFVNDGFETLTGYDRFHYATDVLKFKELIHPEDRGRVLKTIHNAKNRQGRNECDFRIISKDKDTINVNLTCEPVKVKEEPGPVLRSIIQRNTVPKNQPGLMEVARNYNNLDIAAAIILVMSPDGDVKLINKAGCEYLGYAQKEIIGKNWIDHFIPPEQRDELREVFRKIVARELEPVEYNENPVMAACGTIKHVAWHNNYIEDNQGNVIGISSSGYDISSKYMDGQGSYPGSAYSSAETTKELLPAINKKVDQILNEMEKTSGMLVAAVEDDARKEIKNLITSQTAQLRLLNMNLELIHHTGSAKKETINLGSFISRVSKEANQCGGSQELNLELVTNVKSLKFDKFTLEVLLKNFMLQWFKYTGPNYHLQLDLDENAFMFSFSSKMAHEICELKPVFGVEPGNASDVFPVMIGIAKTRAGADIQLQQQGDNLLVTLSLPL